MSDFRSPTEAFLEQAENSIKDQKGEALKVIGMFEIGTAKKEIASNLEECRADLESSGQCEFEFQLGKDRVEVNIDGPEGEIEATRGDRKANFTVPKLGG